MKSQIIQNVFKLMLGTSALLVSVSFFIHTIYPVRANSNDEINFSGGLSPASVVSSAHMAVGCGSGIYIASTDARNSVEAGKKYLQLYPDVARAGLDPWSHYQTYGIGEGRYWPGTWTKVGP